MKPHILVVGATSATRIDQRATLSEAGYFVTACESCATARAALARRTYALAIIDVMLTDGSGIELLSEIRASAHGEHMPVIMLSDRADPKTRIRALAMGADAFIVRPYDTVSVMASVKDLIATHDSTARDSSPPSSCTRATMGRKILLVDDSPTYRIKLAEVLRHDGHEIIVAGSGEEALALLESEHVDAILLDLILPQMDGFEVCHRIRMTANGRHTPILMLTSREHPLARDVGISAGANELIVKSTELQLIKVRLRSLLKQEQGETGSGDRPSSPASAANTLWRTQEDVPRGSLLYRVVMKSGLSSLLGPSTIARACQRAGVDPRTMTAVELVRALPSIRETLSMFLTREEAKLRSDAITELAREALSMRPPTTDGQSPALMTG